MMSAATTPGFVDHSASHEAGWSSLFHLEALARLAVSHILLSHRVVARPIVAQPHSGKRLRPAEMASGCVVMTFLQHLATMLLWYHQFPGIFIVAEG